MIFSRLPQIGAWDDKHKRLTWLTKLPNTPSLKKISFKSGRTREGGEGGDTKLNPLKLSGLIIIEKVLSVELSFIEENRVLKVFSSSKYLPKNFLPVLSFEVLSFSLKPRPEWLSIELQFRRVRVSNPRPEATLLFFLVPHCTFLEANGQHLKFYFGLSDKVAMVPGIPCMPPTELKLIFSASNSFYLP